LVGCSSHPNTMNIAAIATDSVNREPPRAIYSRPPEFLHTA
jgi:hypothetical protein